MVGFCYHKLYADLVTETGAVCVVYTSDLRLAGASFRSFGFELYSAAGQRSVVHGVGDANVRLDAENSLEIAFFTPEGPFGYTCELNPSDGSAIVHEPCPHVCWSVLSAKGKASARGSLCGAGLSGTGYCDKVTLNRWPRTLGLSRIQWGRLHTRAESAVFNRVTLTDGTIWQSNGNGRGDSSDFALEQTEEKLTGIRSHTGVYRLCAGRVLHEGAAVDAARFPSPALRALARLLTGPVFERRVLSSATFEDRTTGVVLHEDVRFGDSALGGTRSGSA